MPNGFKVVLAIIIVALIAGGAYYYKTSQVLTPEEQAVETAKDTGMSEVTNTSDDALVTDSAAIDAQLKGLDADSASVTSGVNEAVTVQ